MLKINGKNDIIYYMQLLQYFGFVKKLIFSNIVKNCSINLTLQVELSCLKIT